MRTTYHVEQGKSYRIRIISATALLMVRLSFADHDIKIVAADGQETQPYPSKYVDIMSGQRFDIILYATRPGDRNNYYIEQSATFNSDWKMGGDAVLTYLPPDSTDTELHAMQTGPSHNVGERITIDPKTFTTMQLKSYLPQQIPEADMMIQIEPSFIISEETGLLHWKLVSATSDKPYKIYNTPLTWMAVMNRWDEVPEASTFIEIPLNAVVDVLVESVSCGSHPIHQHGTNFWMLGWGPGSYNGTESEKTLNFLNPQLIDTFSFVTWQDETDQEGGTPEHCGWARYRFVANNAGMWPLHCHLDGHHAMGMFTGFKVGDTPFPPKEIPTCGQITPTDFTGAKYQESMEQWETAMGEWETAAEGCFGH